MASNRSIPLPQFRAGRVPHEHDEQAAVIAYCRERAALGDARYGMIFSIPNGANLSPAMRAKFDREGRTSGVPDLFLAVPLTPHGGLFIEMKRQKGGAVSAQQKEWIERLNRFGYVAVVCRGAREALDAIERYLGGKWDGEAR